MARSEVPEAQVPYVTSVLELMELLRADLDDRGLRTAALLRRSHPFDKELQIAGLVHCLGSLLRLSDEAVTVGVAAESIRPLLGERVARLVRLQAPHRPTDAHAGHRAGDDAEAVATLCQARDSAAAAAWTRACWRTGSRCWNWSRPVPAGPGPRERTRPPRFAEGVEQAVQDLIGAGLRDGYQFAGA